MAFPLGDEQNTIRAANGRGQMAAQPKPLAAGRVKGLHSPLRHRAVHSSPLVSVDFAFAHPRAAFPGGYDKDAAIDEELSRRVGGVLDPELFAGIRVENHQIAPFGDRVHGIAHRGKGRHVLIPEPTVVDLADLSAPQEQAVERIAGRDVLVESLA